MMAKSRTPLILCCIKFTNLSQTTERDADTILHELACMLPFCKCSKFFVISTLLQYLQLCDIKYIAEAYCSLKKVPILIPAVVNGKMIDSKILECLL